MHFTTSTVLSTLAAAGTVAASNLHHGHSQFHAKRDLEAKRQYQAVNWDQALKDVDWSKVNYGGDKSSAAPAAPAATQPASQAASEPEAVVNVAAAKPATTSKAAAAKPSTTSKAAAAPTSSSASKPSTGGSIASALEDLASWSKLGVQGNSGLNAKASGDNMWIGSDGKYKATFTNDGDKNIAILCWNAQGMWVNAHKPEIFVNVKGGESVTVSIPKGKSGGCGAALPDSTLFMGLLNESILEFTTGDNEKGCFDISREINMDGVVMTSKGSRCTSGIANGDNSCVFVCKNGKSCEAAGTYGIALGSAQEGPCMVGKASDGGSSGGCQFGANGEHMQVTVKHSRSWPAVKGKVA